MRKLSSAPFLSLLALAGLPLVAPAQVAPAAPGSASAGEIVDLTPFIVSTDRDVGYIAENTLAGNRLNTKLADTPGSVAVFTREFLDDLAVTDLRQLVDYSVNSEVSNDSGLAGSFQNSYVNAANLNGGVRTRAMGANQGLDYFTSVAPSDAYRVGRYEDSRGPNSILFGVGPAGGMFNQSSKVAQTGRDSINLRYSTGSWRRQRAEFDANKVLRPGVLGLAVAGVDQHNGGWRQFDYQDRRRGFASVVFRPSRRVSLTAMGESGRDRTAGLRTMTETEEMLAWFDHRAVLGASAVTFTPNNVQPTAAQRALGVVTLNGSRAGTNHRVVMIENDGTIFDAIGTYLTGTYNNSTVRAPDGTPGVTAGALRLNDPGLYPYSMNAGGGGMYREQSLRNYTLSADVELAPKLFLNLGHNYQRTDLTVNFMTGYAPVLRGDPNRTLGIGGPANPYAGRLYFDGEWNRDRHFRDFQESRVALSYSLEPKPAWLGRHRLALLLSQTGEEDLRTLSWLVLAGRPFNALPTNLNNRVAVRNYLTEGSYGTYRAGDWRSLPSSLNFGGTSYRLVFANNAGGSGTNGGAFQTTNTQLAVIQSHWFEERLVTTVGLRRDRVRIEEYGFRSDPDLGDVPDPDPAKRTRNWFLGETKTAGAVWHLRDWVSVIGNYSTNVGVPSFSRTIFPDGRLGDPSKGEGSDVGLGFNLLRGRLNAKLVAFFLQRTRRHGRVHRRCHLRSAQPACDGRVCRRPRRCRPAHQRRRLGAPLPSVHARRLRRRLGFQVGRLRGAHHGQPHRQLAPDAQLFLHRRQADQSHERGDRLVRPETRRRDHRETRGHPKQLRQFRRRSRRLRHDRHDCQVARTGDPPCRRQSLHPDHRHRSDRRARNLQPR
jgi:iron complex outermembrane receptor protein